MNKMRIIGIMSILLAIGCSQKEKLKLGVKPAETQKPVNLKNRPSYAIKAPDFTLRTVQGDLFKLSDYRGKVVYSIFGGLGAVHAGERFLILMNSIKSIKKMDWKSLV